MTISRTYTYLGKMTVPGVGERHIYHGRYSFAATDTYDQGARPTLTFPLAVVQGIMGVTGFADSVNNLGNPVVHLSISGAIVTFMVLESGVAAAGLAEKTDDEVYNVASSICCTVFGI